MKNIWLTVGIILTLLIGSVNCAYAQYILAGQHSESNYYYHIIPDATRTGPYDHGQPRPPAIYEIDINGDYYYEFYLCAYGYWSNGGSSAWITINSHNKHNYQIAVGKIDTCFRNNYYNLYFMAKSFRAMDTIGNNLFWTHVAPRYSNDTSLLLTYRSYSIDSGVCFPDDFDNDSLGNYIGVRITSPTDTVYGWIKVTNIDFLTFTIQEFAFGKKITGMDEYSNGIEIYPIPTINTVTIETPLADHGLAVYNQYGIEIMKRTSIARKAQIDLTGWASGVYFFKFFRDKSVVVKKIVKN